MLIDNLTDSEPDWNSGFIWHYCAYDPRPLTQSELETLFNDGVGLSYPFAVDEPEPDVVVKLPDNQQVCR